MTRHATGVRGVAFGYLIAFDRYTNLILQDVTEHYTVRLRRAEASDATDDGVGVPGTPRGKGRVKTKISTDRRTRHVQQVFLRGEQVVSVATSPPDDEWPERGDGTACTFWRLRRVKPAGKTPMEVPPPPAEG